MMDSIENGSSEPAHWHGPADSSSRRKAHDDRSSATDLPVVLIVDDVADNLLAFEGMLRRDDVEIVTALSGRAALDILLDRNVALAIIDVQMPEMDGFELAALMRGVEKTRYVPIVFVTAGSREPSRVFKGYEVGAVDYLFKPVDERVLRGKVDVFVTLEKQRQQLLQADRMREMFVGILGHDLRNPLQGILMTAELVLSRSKDETMRKPLEGIRQCGDRMARMIEQILDLTRIRLGGGLLLSSTPVDFHSIVEQVIEEFAEHESRFSVEVVGDTHGSWDIDRILQVLSNLAGNAVEHSPPGAPVLIRVDGRLDDALECEVRNGGPGVPSGLRDALFEPFRGRDRTRGLGLGLFICKQIVVAHGGTIEFESSDESGTRFQISLPRHTAFGGADDFGEGSVFAAEAMLPRSEAGLRRERHRRGTDDRIADGACRAGAILVVDDDPSVRDSLEFLLNMDGHQVMAAADGDEAAEIVARNGVRPDMVIVDYNLAEGVIGLQVVTRLRERLGHDLPALILTGDRSTGSLRNIALHNCTQLSKPAKLEELTQAIQRLLE
ncbi:response regulator [Methylocapsa polymorpha]|uniref:histidine kinase n=1 Tax=Methylocapsa polymorpha TaxID=3080828 RepID=A0ABZ0HVH8_9HYPH|nr:response regulator [Methylocapsa sp. RX1]